MAVQCPHCSMQMKAGECRAAEVRAAAAQPYVPVTTAQETAARAAVPGHRWGRRLLPVAIAGLILGGGAMAWQLIWGGGGAEISTTSGGQNPSLPGAAAEEREWLAVVTAFLEAREWQALPALSAEAARVRPLMEWYYDRHPFPWPASKVKLIQSEQENGNGWTRVVVHVATAERATVWLMVLWEDGAWKVDWEAYAAFAPARWSAFLRESAGTEVELNLLAALKPAADSYLIKSGGSPDTHEALVMWAATRDSLAGALVPRRSPLRGQLAGIGFNDAIQVVARVKMEDPWAEPPLVSIQKVIQTGWNRQHRGP